MVRQCPPRPHRIRHQIPPTVYVPPRMFPVPCIVVECLNWRCCAEQSELEVARVARVKFLSRDACVREDIAVRSPPLRRAAVGPCQRGEQGNTAKRRTLQPDDAVARGRTGPPSEFLSRDACASGVGCHRSLGHQSAGRRGRRIWQGDVLFQSLSPSPHPTHPTIQPPPSSGFLSRDGCPSGRACRRGEIPSSSRRAAGYRPGRKSEVRVAKRRTLRGESTRVARDDVARLRRCRKLSTSRRSDTSIRRILEQGWLLEVTRAPVLDARAFPLKNCPNS